MQACRIATFALYALGPVDTGFCFPRDQKGITREQGNKQGVFSMGYNSRFNLTVCVEDNTSTHTELTLNYEGNCYQKLQTQQQSIKLTNGLLL